MQRIYIIFDKAAENFVGRLITAKADAPVVRDFYDLCASPDNIISRHPQDYDLRQVGTIDDFGLIDSLGDFRIVTSGEVWLATQDTKPFGEPLTMQPKETAK